ncbi:hypothetical protein AYO40_03630 [Planctomycetaceae bacterium SCGC AG-212-D15]|nr:hypothetical protein AYO40_03630 [Planctomycetaceae bacterium SCGC AG-212-D15]
MVVATTSADFSRSAFGLLLIFNGVNLMLFVSNLFVGMAVFLPALNPTLVGPGLVVGLILMFLQEAFTVLGMGLCVSAPVGSGFRVIAGSAFVLMAASLIVTLGLFLPKVLKQAFGGSADDPTAAWTLALALGTVAHVLFFAFLGRLAQRIGRPTLARWPFLLLAGAVAVLVTAAAAVLVAGEGMAMGICWIGTSLLLCGYAYYLLVLRQAVADAAEAAGR